MLLYSLCCKLPEPGITAGLFSGKFSVQSSPSNVGLRNLTLQKRHRAWRNEAAGPIMTVNKPSGPNESEWYPDWSPNNKQCSSKASAGRICHSGGSIYLSLTPTSLPFSKCNTPNTIAATQATYHFRRRDDPFGAFRLSRYGIIEIQRGRSVRQGSNGFGWIYPLATVATDP